jgi:uncharacterized protein YggT (Ycf19 family)
MMTIDRQSERADEPVGQTAVADRPAVVNDSVVEEQVVSSSAAGAWDTTRGWIRSLGAIIMVALAVVETFLVGRLAFLLAEANPGNGFVNFVYDVSKPLAAPFQGIVADSGNLEYASPIAMAVYAVAALLLIAALFAITSGPSGSGDRVVSSRTQHSDRLVR